jgi:hypothetical protein
VLDGATPEVAWPAKGADVVEDTAIAAVGTGADTEGIVVEAAGEGGVEVAVGRDSASGAATALVASATDEGRPVETAAGAGAGTICSTFETTWSDERSGARCSD